MSPRKRTASPTAAAATTAGNDDPDAGPSPAAAAKKRRAASASASASASVSPAPAAKAAAAPRKAASPAKKKQPAAAADENNAPNEEQQKKATAKAAAAAKKPAGDDKTAADAADEAPSFLGPPPVPFSKAKEAKGFALYDAASMRPAPYEGPNAWRVVSWNVAGLRSMVAKHPGALAALAARERADALCLQETKLQAADAERLFGPCTGSSKDLGDSLGLPGWTAAAWACSGANGTKKGYAGVVLLVRAGAARVSWARVGLGGGGAAKSSGGGGGNHDDEGRTVAARLEDASGASRPPLTVVGVYVPNSGEGLKRLKYRTDEWDPALVAFVGGLMKGGGGGGDGGDNGNGNDNGDATKDTAAKELVVVAGDLNVAHREVDIHSPDTNKRSAGFTDEERASISCGLIGGSALAAGEGGGGGGKGLALVDSFRARHPKVLGYTYFSYRSRARVSGKGWRLDYCLVPEWCVVGGKEEDEEADGGSANGARGGPRLYDSYILPDVAASDHVPLGVVIKT